MLFGPPGIQSPAVGGRKAFRAHVVGVVVIEHVSAPGRLFETAQQRSPGCRVGAVYNGFLHICSHSVDEKRTATQPHHMNLLRHTPNTLHNHTPGFTLQRRPHRESCTQASRRCDDTVAVRGGAAKETASVGDRPRAPLSSDQWAKEGGCLTSVPCRCSMASRGRFNASTNQLITHGFLGRGNVLPENRRSTDGASTFLACVRRRPELESSKLYTTK